MGRVGQRALLAKCAHKENVLSLASRGPRIARALVSIYKMIVPTAERVGQLVHLARSVHKGNARCLA